MILQLIINGKIYKVDTGKPLEITIPLKNGNEQVNCFHIPPYSSKPLVVGSFIGDRSQGGSINCSLISVYPHGNGTHTECVGHISDEKHTIYDCLKESFFPAYLISVSLEKDSNGDTFLDRKKMKELLHKRQTKALIIRTLPNDVEKLSKNYSSTNPPFIHTDTMKSIVASGIEHLIVDIPSVDKEEDGGKLLSHHIFWDYPANPRIHCTITEMVYIPESIIDGKYMVNIQTGAYDVDASPSRVILYSID
jgi:kynurenine formamidase